MFTVHNEIAPSCNWLQCNSRSQVANQWSHKIPYTLLEHKTKLIVEVATPQVINYIYKNKFYYVMTFTTIKQVRFHEAVTAAPAILEAKISPNVLYSSIFQD
jgi:hypothetical protein